VVVLTVSDKVYPDSSDDNDAVVETCETLIQTTASDAPDKDMFETFKSDHKKKYESEEEENYRYEIFSQTLKRIESKNKNRKGRGVEQTQGINKFSDKTVEEFKTMLGFLPHERLSVVNTTAPVKCPACQNFKEIVTKAKKDNKINWVDLGAVTAVKNQGSCG